MPDNTPLRQGFSEPARERLPLPEASAMNAAQREAADALIAGLEADEAAVLILHPFLLVGDEERGEAERVLRRVAELVSSGERWVATGREVARGVR